jgi:hypothetical protein
VSAFCTRDVYVSFLSFRMEREGRRIKLGILHAISLRTSVSCCRCDRIPVPESSIPESRRSLPDLSVCLYVRFRQAHRRFSAVTEGLHVRLEFRVALDPNKHGKLAI